MSGSGLEGSRRSPSKRRYNKVGIGIGIGSFSKVKHQSQSQPLQLAAKLLVLIVLIGSISEVRGNLCTLCQSLRERLPQEFHSCSLRNLEIRHCDEGVDTHLSSLKIVGVKRIVKVNYEQGDGVIWWEVGVSVVQDGGGMDSSSHHHTQNTSLHQSPSSSHYASTQLAVIRFSRYPSSLLLPNPCRHVLGTTNYNSVYSGKAVLARKQGGGQQQHHLPQSQSQQQRTIGSGAAAIGVLSSYFVIDDKMCRDGTGHRGIMTKRRKCIPTPSNASHPYDCCVIQTSSTECSVSSTSPAQQTPPPPTSQSNTEEQDYLRPLTLSIQCICICFTLILSCVVFWIRKSKVIQVSVWPLTESIIFGSTLLYSGVALRAAYKFDLVDEAHHRLGDWFGEGEPEEDQGRYWACVAEPWAREIGFTLVYGGIVLKIYRSLVEFKTRKAHRWVVREKDILRYLGTTVSVTFFYLVSWSCTVGEFRGGTPGGQIVCPEVTNWHRVTELGELLYIAVGLNMAWHLRTSPVSPFLERQMYTAALVLEATASVLLIIVRECKLMFFSEEENGSQAGELESGGGSGSEEDGGGFLLILYFVRCHLTATVILGLVLGPKLYYVYVDATTRKRAGQLRRGDTLTATGGGASTGGGGGGGAPTSASLSNLTTLKIPPHGITGGVDQATLIDLDFAEVSLAEMDPKDIKTELKRVYTQLELLRNKTMRKDNPHISKRRGGRKPTHRRFSLQKKGSRDKTAAVAAAMRSRMQAQSHQEEGRGYGNNRFSGRYNDDIEDSVCSIEGPSTYSEVGRGYR